MKHRRTVLALMLVGCCLVRATVLGASEPVWNMLAVARFGNIDAIDAEDGDLAGFIKSIRNDGRFTPPMRTLVGPEIRNPTFFGLVYEAWIEGVVLAPTRPGGLETLWVFPVDNRDEYVNQLLNQGLSEYEGMDGITVLREMDQDGNVRTWHLEWLPGNIAVLGKDRTAVTACKHMYAANGASRGLLFRAGGEYLEPDVFVRLNPRTVATWQDREPGLYWWRERIGKLTKDLLDYWDTTPTRQRLVYALSDQAAALPHKLERLDMAVWFEPAGVEWRFEAVGDFPGRGSRSELETLRRFPDRTAMAYAIPVDREYLNRLASLAAELLLGGAGGVVNRETRDFAATLYSVVLDGAPTQAAIGWIPAPAGLPELGAVRMLVMEWERPEVLDSLWLLLNRVVEKDNPASQIFSQLGWDVKIETKTAVPGTSEVVVLPTGGQSVEPYYNAAFAFRRQGLMTALVVGSGRSDSEALERVLRYRAEVALTAVNVPQDGGPDIRTAFTRMGTRGASFLGFLEPVRLLQLVLVEEGDWRPRSPDQNEPVSSQLAREMLEYGYDRAWTASGESEPGVWRFNGGLSWHSLGRLSAALGITESIGME